MRLSIVWLGLIASTASAGWILPESRRERHDAQAPHHHYNDDSSSRPANTKHVQGVHLASDQSHLKNGPTSALGAMLHDLRLWFNDHNLRSPSILSSYISTPAIPTFTDDIHELLVNPPSDYTVSIDWGGPVFADMDGLASNTLSDGEIMARVRPMLLDPTSTSGYLPGLKSGAVRIVVVAPDRIELIVFLAGFGRPEGSGSGPARDITRVGPGMTGDAMGRRVEGQITEVLVSIDRFQVRRAGLIKYVADHMEKVSVPPSQVKDDRRLVQLNFREVWFADDDLAHPLSAPKMAEKVTSIIGDGRQPSPYLPTMKSGLIRAVYASRGETETREFLPGYWREGGAGEHAPEYEENKDYSEEDYESMRQGTYRPPNKDVKPWRGKVGEKINFQP